MRTKSSLKESWLNYVGGEWFCVPPQFVLIFVAGNCYTYVFDKKMFSLDHIPVMICQVVIKCAFNADGVVNLE